MDRFYEDFDIPSRNFPRDNESQRMNWNMRNSFSNPRDYYRNREHSVSKNVSNYFNPNHFNGHAGNRFTYPPPQQYNNFQRYHYFDQAHDSRNYHAQRNVLSFLPRNPFFNVTPQNLQGSSGLSHSSSRPPDLHSSENKNYIRDCKESSQKIQEYAQKKALPNELKEASQKNQESAKKEALANELKKSLRKFQKNHSKNSDHLLVLDKSKEKETLPSTTKVQPCFPWDLPLTVDDLKSIGRGKTGNTSEVCADSCNENELNSLERLPTLREKESTEELSADSSPEVQFIKQCRKRQRSESIKVVSKKPKLNNHQVRRRHRSASPNLCEEIIPEDKNHSIHSSFENLSTQVTNDDSYLTSKPSVDGHPKPNPSNTLVKLLGVQRRELKEMVEQPRNPRVQFMLSLLMKRHKELLVQRANRSRFSTLRKEFTPNCEAGRRKPDDINTEMQKITSTSLEGLGASDTIDCLSNILLESSLTVDISSLPQELIDQLGNFLEMGVDFGNISEEMSNNEEGNLNTSGESIEFVSESICDANNSDSIDNSLKINETEQYSEKVQCQTNTTRIVNNTNEMKRESKMRPDKHSASRVQKESPSNSSKIKENDLKGERIQFLSKRNKSSSKNESRNRLSSGSSNTSGTEETTKSVVQQSKHVNAMQVKANEINSNSFVVTSLVDSNSQYKQHGSSLGDLGVNNVNSGSNSTSSSKKGTKSSSQNNSSDYIQEVIMEASPSTPVHSNFSKENISESEKDNDALLARMWEIDQKIVELMNEKRQLYEKLQSDRLQTKGQERSFTTKESEDRSNPTALISSSTIKDSSLNSQHSSPSKERESFPKTSNDTKNETNVKWSKHLNSMHVKTNELKSSGFIVNFSANSNSQHKNYSSSFRDGSVDKLNSRSSSPSYTEKAPKSSSLNDKSDDIQEVIIEESSSTLVHSNFRKESRSERELDNDSMLAKKQELDKKNEVHMDKKQQLNKKLLKDRPQTTFPERSLDIKESKGSSKPKALMPSSTIKDSSLNSQFTPIIIDVSLPSCASSTSQHSSAIKERTSVPQSSSDTKNEAVGKQSGLLNSSQVKTNELKSSNFVVDSQAESSSSCLDSTSNNASKNGPLKNSTASSNNQETLDRHLCEYNVNEKAVLNIKVKGRYLYVACADLKVHCFHWRRNELIRTFSGHTKTITCIYLHCENEYINLFSGSHDKQLLKFNAKRGNLMKRKEIDHPIQCMEQGWGILYIGTKIGTIERYVIETSKFCDLFLTNLHNEIMAIQTSKEGPRRVLIVATRNKPIFVCDAFSGLLLRAINVDIAKHTVFTMCAHNGVVFSGTSVYGLTAWNFTNGKFVQRYEKCGSVVALKILNKKIYAASYDGNIYIYNIGNSKPVHIIKASDKMLLCMEIMEDLIYAGSLDGKLRYWKKPS